MADEETFAANEVENFQRCSAKLFQMVIQDTEEFRREINTRLDELNSIEYSLANVTEEDSVQVLARCCYLVPLKHDQLVTKLCSLVRKLVAHQQLVPKQHVDTVVEYLINALRTCHPWTHTDILYAMSAMLYENVGRVTKFLDELIGPEGLLLHFCQSSEEDLCQASLLCLQNLCFKCDNDVCLGEEEQDRCMLIFMQVLYTSKPSGMDDTVYAKMLMTAFRGIQNITLARKTFPTEHLSKILSAIKVYMVYGLPGQVTTLPSDLQPLPMSQYDVNPPPKTRMKSSHASPPKAVIEREQAKKSKAEGADSQPAEEEISLRPATPKSTPTKVMSRSQQRKQEKKKKANRNTKKKKVPTATLR